MSLFFTTSIDAWAIIDNVERSWVKHWVEWSWTIVTSASSDDEQSWVKISSDDEWSWAIVKKCVEWCQMIRRCNVSSSKCENCQASNLRELIMIKIYKLFE